MKLKLPGILGFFISATLTAQYQPIGGVVNSYYPVDAVSVTSVQCTPGTDLSTLSPGDKVVLIQNTGFLVNDEPPEPPMIAERTLSGSQVANVGRYELLAVKTINDGTDVVTFTDTLGTYSNGERIQIVKILEADFAEVNTTLEAQPWNGQTGGVVALVVFKKLRLHANIDVSGQGFRGGAVESNYNYGCWPISTYVLNVLGTQTNRAGSKGEGLAEISCLYTKGPGPLVTGGGGGLGKYSGGAGGGNYNTGGGGGSQANGCDPVTRASGGIQLLGFYNNTRIGFGGGGGSSTEPSSANPATPGGNGGGLVIILADTLESNGYSILSNGQTVSAVADAGAGGGGAGGTIALDIGYYADQAITSVKGGKGGNTNSTFTSTGAGGGGGGGIVLFANPAKPARLRTDTLGGARGLAATSDHHGYAGAAGGSLPNLELPLNGFLFNTLNGSDTVCAGNKPRIIVGSVPKGGAYSYVYTWLQSPDDATWSLAAGSGDSTHFQPDALTTTTYFTRVVQSGDVSDTSISVKVFVFNAIAGNNLNLRDTLCYATSPGTLSTGVLSGGNGSYSYRWQADTEGGNWLSRGTNASLVESTLTESTYYRCIVTSARVCIDTSAADTITILPSISQNTFPLAYSDTAVCAGLDAGTIRPGQPAGGEAGNYHYQWLEGVSAISFVPLPMATGMNYSPGVVPASRYYKRIVRSGEGNACIDTSNAFFLEVYPVIGSNTIQTDSTRYCWGDVPEIITGDLPEGGNAPNYLYRWLERTKGGSWGILAGQNSRNYLPTRAYGDSVEVRRVVESGRYSACIDTSNMLALDVIPQIENTLLTADTSLCEASTPLPFVEGVATGGNGGFTYRWQQQLVSGGNWQTASELPNDGAGYISGELIQSMRFRRAAQSEICTTYSNAIEVTIYPTLANNQIWGGTLQYTCFNTGIALSTPALEGGMPGDTPRYLWQQSLNTTDWQESAGTANAFDYLSPSLQDSIYYRRIVRSGEYDQCIDTTDAVLVRINPLPTGDILSGIDTACSDGSIAVQYSSLEGNRPWTLVLATTATDAFTTSDIEQSEGQVDFPVQGSGTLHVLDLIDDSACHANLSLMSGAIELKVYTYPQVNAGVDDEVCGRSYTLQPTPDGEGGVWQGDYLYSDSTLPGTTVTIDSYSGNTLQTFTWKEWNWNCESSDEVAIRFYEQPVQPDLGANVVLDNRFEYQLNAPEPIGNGRWTVSGPGTVHFENDDSSLSQVQVDLEYPIIGQYQFIWTVSNGVCQVMDDTLWVSVDEVMLYDGFSPNGDAINDEYIINLSGKVTATLTILDRWGNLVYTTSGKDQLRWDGMSDHHKNMPAGAYAYILTRPGLPTRQGFIELRR